MQSNYFLILQIIAIFEFSSASKGFETRVVGGYEASAHFGQVHASLQNLKGQHVCGGAVISYQHVATAAHCLVGAEAKYITIVVGTTNLDHGGKQYDVETILMHPEYDADLRSNDIAIVKSSTSFDSNDVKILHLYRNEILEGDNIVLTGFGALQPNGDSSRVMNALNLTVFNQDTCVYAMRYTRQVLDSMFCTFTEIGKGTCHGDSGGPLVRNDQLYGLVSWGVPCAVGFPDVHTRITPYIDWIMFQIKNL